MSEYRDIIQSAFDIVTGDNVDMVEVIRCRDCRHFEFGEVHMFDGRRVDGCMCARMAGCRVATDPDGFCWRGERRDA